MDFISLAQYENPDLHDSPAFTHSDFECDDCGHLGHTSCAGEGWEGDYGDPDNIFGY